MFFIFLAYIIYFFSYTFPLNLLKHLLFLLTIISLDDKYKPYITEFTWQILKYVHYIVFFVCKVVNLTKFTNTKLKATKSREHTWDDLIPLWKFHSLFQYFLVYSSFFPHKHKQRLHFCYLLFFTQKICMEVVCGGVYTHTHTSFGKDF